MKDTPDSVEAEYRRRVMSLEPGERLAMACRMFSAAKALALAGMTEREIESAGGVRAALFLRFYGRDFSEAERAKIVAHLNAT